MFGPFDVWNERRQAANCRWKKTATFKLGDALYEIPRISNKSLVLP